MDSNNQIADRIVRLFTEVGKRYQARGTVDSVEVAVASNGCNYVDAFYTLANQITTDMCADDAEVVHVRGLLGMSDNVLCAYFVKILDKARMEQLRAQGGDVGSRQGATRRYFRSNHVLYEPGLLETQLEQMAPGLIPPVTSVQRVV